MTDAPPYAGPDSDLQPNAEHIKAFVAWWFERCTKGKVEIGWLDAKGRGLIHFAQFEKDQLDELIATAFQANLVPGQSCYVRASTVAARDDTVTKFTTDNDVIQSPGVWGDIDTKEQLERAKTVESMVRPNGYVITGTLPHMRVQNWFKASNPIESTHQVRSLNTRLHKLYGGDSSVINPSRLMRLPGTIAWPWKKDRTIPEVTRFLRPPQSDPRPNAYSLQMLLAQLPADAEANAEHREQAPSPPSTGLRATLSTTNEYIRLIQSGHEWHNNVIRLVAHWVGRGWSDGEILAASEAFTLTGYTNAQTLSEVRKAIDGARRKWGVPEQAHVVTDTPDTPFSEHIVDPWDTLIPPEFPIDSLPDVLKAYVEGRARVLGADPCAIAWAAISAASAAVDGRVRLRVKRHDTWTVPPAIWVALIGRSSAKKTPVTSDAWQPLEELQGIALSAYADQMAQWNRLSKQDKKDILPPPKPRRLVSHDSTMEACQEVLSHQDRGIGILRDELAGFIGAMEKYSGGGGSADRAFWLQSYNGVKHVVDRVGRGVVPINNLLTSICGGIQPDRLAKFTDLADDGLWQRFVPIIMHPSNMGSDEPIGDEVTAYRECIKRIVADSVGSHSTMTEGAHEIREGFERDIFELEQSEALGSKYASFVGKMPGLFGRLCLVLAHIEPTGITANHDISKRIANMARSLIKNCVIPHAARVYMTMEAHVNGVDSMQGIAGYLLTKKMERVVISDLTSNVRCCRKVPVQDVMRMVSPLISGGWLVPENETGSNRVWLVNPSVHTQFTARAITEAAKRQTARELLLEDLGVV